MLTIGSSPPRLMSKLPGVLAGVLDDDVAQEAGRRLGARAPAAGAGAAAPGAGGRRGASAGRSRPRPARRSPGRRARSRSPPGPAPERGPRATRRSPRASPPIELADIAPWRVTPCASGCQPIAASSSTTCAAEAVHVPGDVRIRVVGPDHARVDVGGGHGLAAAEAAEREPAELGGRRAQPSAIVSSISLRTSASTTTERIVADPGGGDARVVHRDQRRVQLGGRLAQGRRRRWRRRSPAGA